MTADPAAARADDAPVVLLDRPPALAPLMAGALSRRRRPAGAPVLPATRVVVPGVRTPLERLAAFSRVTGAPLTGALPATWVHVLTFPLQVRVMADPGFPFPMLGMVHLANRMEQRRPVAHDEPLTLLAWADSLRPHAKGATVDLCGEARVGEEVVWRGESTYLVRGASAGGGPQGSAPLAPAPEATARQVLLDGPPQVLWRVPAGIGRRYAAVSGDVNPIHLSPLTAKALGFPRTIAHGMWTHARALAALSPRVGEAYEVRVEFRKPLLVPATVGLWASGRATGSAAGSGAERLGLAVASRRGDRVHLTGEIVPLPAG